MPRAQQGKKNVSLYLDEDVYKWARKLAIDEGRPFTEILAEVLNDWGRKRMNKAK